MSLLCDSMALELRDSCSLPTAATACALAAAERLSIAGSPRLVLNDFLINGWAPYCELFGDLLPRDEGCIADA